ncbi:MAG: helix-turn-helix transcriptional regulator [Clostridiales bacterium]|nr:helix-turn-helix transcriptional regulator [Clostridiales bacterium]
MNLSENIALFRHSAGMTQEELAVKLGVTNQSVSKWESGQCCPDISLLPELAGIFNVSVDRLLGCELHDRACGSAVVSNDIVAEMRSRLEAMPREEAHETVLKWVFALHAIILSKDMTTPPSGNPGWDSNAAIEHAQKREWGYSCVNLPEITTCMRRESVFWSGNKQLCLDNRAMRKISRISRLFGALNKLNNLKVLVAMYELTLYSEDAHVSAAEIAEKCQLNVGEVMKCLDDPLAEFIHTNGDLYRINGTYMDLPPLLAMLAGA